MITTQHGRSLAVLVAVLLGATLIIGVASGANASYYNNSSGVVQPDAPQNATLQNIVELAVEISPNLIGVGEQDRSGSGFQGILLTGLVFAGVALGAMAGTGVGPIGGSILGSVVSYGLVDLGYAPPWVKPLLLFGIGTLAYMMFKRVFR